MSIQTAINWASAQPLFEFLCSHWPLHKTQHRLNPNSSWQYYVPRDFTPVDRAATLTNLTLLSDGLLVCYANWSLYPLPDFLGKLRKQYGKGIIPFTKGMNVIIVQVCICIYVLVKYKLKSDGANFHTASQVVTPVTIWRLFRILKDVSWEPEPILTFFHILFFFFFVNSVYWQISISSIYI